MKNVASGLRTVSTRFGGTGAQEPGSATGARASVPVKPAPVKQVPVNPLQFDSGASPDQGRPVVVQPLARLYAVLLGAFLLLCATLARADNVFVKSVDLTNNGGEYFLSASFDISLTPTVEEALNRGVPLHFLVEFELIYPRWYTLYLWNKLIVEQQQNYRLSYNALTRQYRLSYGVLQQTFDTVESALSVLGGIENQQVFDASVLDDDRVYEAQLRMRLDISRLPKPIQIDALGSDAWDVSSPWFRWTVQR